MRTSRINATTPRLIFRLHVEIKVAATAKVFPVLSRRYADHSVSLGYFYTIQMMETYSSAANHSVTILPSPPVLFALPPFIHPLPPSPSSSLLPSEEETVDNVGARGGRCNETDWKRAEPGRCWWIVKYWPDWRAPTNDFFIERFRFDYDRRQRE